MARVESTNLQCSRIDTLVSPSILRRSTRHLHWKHTLIANAQTYLLAIGHHFNASFASSVSKTKTPWATIEWWHSALNTRGRIYSRCTPLGQSLKLRSWQGWVRNMGRPYQTDSSNQANRSQCIPPKGLHQQNNMGRPLVCHLEGPNLRRRRRFMTSVAMKTFHELQIKVQAISLFCLILQFLGRNLLAQLRRPWRSLQQTR